MTVRAQALSIIRSFLGITESPPHSNRTPIGVEFGWNGVAWCAETISVTWNRAFGKKILWTASVAQAIADAHAGKNGMKLLPRNAVIREGMAVTYDWTGHGDSNNFHIAMVVNPGDQTRFETIGGNENDSVRQQWRDRTYVTHFIDGPYEEGGTPPPSPSPEEDEDMPIAFERVIMPGEKTFIAVPPCKSGGAHWGQVWGSLGADNYDLKDNLKPTPVRIAIKGNGPAGQGWYAPNGADKNGIVLAQSGRQYGWAFNPGDEGVSLENQGTHAVSFLCEAVKG